MIVGVVFFMSGVNFNWIFIWFVGMWVLVDIKEVIEMVRVVRVVWIMRFFDLGCWFDMFR